MDFKKEKLSSEALDNFAIQYKLSDSAQNETSTFDYILLNGEKITLSGKKIFNKNNIASSHFEYLLGQTLPYHQPKDIKHLTYSLRDLMFIIDENGKPVPWTRNKLSLVQFTKLAEYQGLLLRSKLR